MIAIACSNLVKRYGSLKAVDNLNLQIETGECFGLLGPNGAGKTTTAELLEGLIKPDDGTITVLGSSWGSKSDGMLREKLGVALQETKLTDKLTVKETLQLFGSFYKQAKPTEEVVDLLGLGEKTGTWVSRLSGGQRQRLALACALVGSPEILFLDEPTTGLDPQARRSIWDVVEKFKKSGGTVLLTTHYMEEAERLCDRVGIMDMGRLIALDTPTKLIESLDATQIIEIAAETPLDGIAFNSIRGVRYVEFKEDGSAVIRVDKLESTLSLVLDEIKQHGLSILFLRTRRATLEDVFVAFTGRALRDE